MPELPEVETIRLGLQKKIIGLKITKIQILSPKSFQNEKGQPFDYAQGLRGRKVLNIWRKAKYLGVDVSGNVTLLFHLKMSGQLIWIKTQNSNVKTQNYNSKLKTDDRFIGGHPTPDMVGPLPNPHTRVIFSFSDGSHLYFNDQRKFGWIRVIKNNELRIMNNGFLGKLGPEPLEKSFTWELLKENLLKHESLPIKVAIMDQKVVSGVGNIYSNEVCFDAKIDPRTKVNDMDDKQFQALYRGIIKALNDGIKYGGATRAHFVDAEGHKGYFLDYAFVYGRDKHKCKKCGTEIKKISLGGRGTYFCPKCQKGVK